MLNKIVKIILIVIWMIIVFIFSSQPGETSTNTSRGFIRRTVISVVDKTEFTSEQKEEIIVKIEPIIRKLAHFTLYMVGGILIINFVNTKHISEFLKIGISVLIGFLYACSDEFHQFFVPGRSASPIDVGIDTLGVITGVMAFCLIVWAYKKIKVVGKTCIST